MRRRILVGSAALFGAMLAMILAGVHLVASSQHEIETAFATDRLRELSDAAHALGADLQRLGDDLALAARLVESPAPREVEERELRAILAIERRYLAVEARGPADTVRVAAPDAPPEILARAEPVIDHTIELARRTPGELQISPGLSAGDDPSAWYRVFARQPPGSEMVIAAVVDMRLLVAPPALLRAGTSRLLVLSAHGVPAPASDRVMAELVPHPGAPVVGHDQLRALLASARALHSGTLRIGAGEARTLGLPDASAVAAAVPVPIDHGPPWVLMLVSSAQSLQAQQQQLVWRFVGGTATALAIVILVAIYLARQARRAAAMRERVRHVELLAHLTDKAEKILDHIPSGVIALDAEGRTTAMNRWLSSRISGDLAGRTLEHLFASAPPAEVARVLELVASAHTTRTPRSIHRARLALLGEETYLSLHAIPLERPLADVAMLLVVEDLSPLQRTEERLLHTEKLVSAGQLAAGIAHEIGTPLNIARGRAELTLARLGKEHAQAHSQQVIIGQIDHVITLIQQLLDYLRPRALAVRAVDVARAIRAVVDMLTAHAASRRVGLRVELAEAAPAIRADPGQLQQVLVNLVMNAIDACPAGGHVTLRTQPRHAIVIIEVIDDGAGMAPEARTQAFDAFFTTKKRGQGTGLGLWVVAQVARAHDAELELVSAPGTGTTVRVSWPSWQEDVRA